MSNRMLYNVPPATRFYVQALGEDVVQEQPVDQNAYVMIESGICLLEYTCLNIYSAIRIPRGIPVEMYTISDCCFSLQGRTITRCYRDEDDKTIFLVEQPSYVTFTKVQLTETVEMSFSTDSSPSHFIECISGQIEIFRYKINAGETRFLPPSFTTVVNTTNYALFKLHGQLDKMEIAKAATKEYYEMICEDIRKSPMYMHRDLASKEKKVLVIGSSCTGKTSFCNYLLNYAIQTEKKVPFFVDLNVDCNSGALPGVITVQKIHNVRYFRNVFSKTKKSDQLNFYFGHTHPSSNIPLYCLLVQRCMQEIWTAWGKLSLKHGEEHDPFVVVDMHSVSSELSSLFIPFIISVFQINTVVIMEGNNFEYRIYNDCKKECAFLHTVPQFFDPVPNANAAMVTQANVGEYFAGVTNGILLDTRTFVQKISDTVIYEVESHYQIGLKEFRECSPDDIEVRRVAVEPRIIGKILGVSNYSSKAIERKSLAFSEIELLVCVQDVDLENQVITLIYRHNARLKGKILLMGAVRNPYTGYF